MTDKSLLSELKKLYPDHIAIYWDRQAMLEDKYVYCGYQMDDVAQRFLAAYFVKHENDSSNYEFFYWIIGEIARCLRVGDSNSAFEAMGQRAMDMVVELDEWQEFISWAADREREYVQERKAESSLKDDLCAALKPEDV